MRKIANFVTYRTKFIRMLRNNCFAYDTLAYKQPIIAKKLGEQGEQLPIKLWRRPHSSVF